MPLATPPAGLAALHSSSSCIARRDTTGFFEPDSAPTFHLNGVVGVVVVVVVVVAFSASFPRVPLAGGAFGCCCGCCCPLLVEGVVLSPSLSLARK